MTVTTCIKCHIDLKNENQLPLFKFNIYINQSVLSDNINGPASVACQSLIIHHDECCGENSGKHSDEDEDITDDDDEESPIFQDSILDMYR